MNSAKVQLPLNKNFGLFFGFIFILLSLYFLYKNNIIIFLIIISLSLIFLVITFINADLLLPLNKLWMQFGLLLGAIISPIVLGIIFFGLFTPIGLICRFVKRDELSLNIKDKLSYWKKRSIKDLNMDNFKNQF